MFPDFFNVYVKLSLFLVFFRVIKGVNTVTKLLWYQTELQIYILYSVCLGVFVFSDYKPSLWAMNRLQLPVMQNFYGRC